MDKYLYKVDFMAKTIGCQHPAVFITEKIVAVFPTTRFEIVPQDTQHLTTQRDDLNLVRLRMPEYNSATG